jgi:uncharacterized protein YndB with AHSA1/START domain
VNENQIQDTITVEAAPQRVFRALTDAEALEQWMATKAESDAEPGGRFRYEFEFEDAAQNNVQEGSYVAIDAERLVAIPWVFPFSPKVTTVEFELEPADDATRVSFTHAGFEEGEPWDGARERFTGGWRMFLESLKRYVETGTPSHPLGIKSRR